MAVIVVKLVMIKNICITMLKEVQENTGLSDTKMAALLDVSVESYRRWKKERCFPNQPIILKRIEQVVTEYHKAS